MRRLHLVGFTSELDGLILSAKDGARSGGYVVALDSELLDAIREVLERRDRSRSPAAAAPLGPPRSPQGSSLSPREIQARLRAGRRIEDVAMEAGVDDEWVRRFATPVLAERAHVAARAQAAVLEVEGRGLSTESLGGSVAANLADLGEPLTPGELSEGWDAYQLRETSWVVEFRAPLRTREQAARWGFDTRTARLTVLNPAAAELGWVGAGGRDAVALPQPVVAAPAPVDDTNDARDEAADEAPGEGGNGAAPVAQVAEQLRLEPSPRPRRAGAGSRGSATPAAARRSGRGRGSAANGAGGRSAEE